MSSFSWVISIGIDLGGVVISSGLEQTVICRVSRVDWSKVLMIVKWQAVN